MIYYISEYNYYEQLNKKLEYTAHTAASKARLDCEYIISNLQADIKPIYLDENKKNTNTEKSLIKKTKSQFEVKKDWLNKTKNLKDNDVLIAQVPFRYHSIFLNSVLKKLKKRNIKLIFIIHDIPWFRKYTSFAGKIHGDSYKKQFGYADKIIVHNDKMKDFFLKFGFKDRQIVTLTIFDYLTDINKINNYAKDKPIIIAGNLANYKCEYLRYLPDDIDFNLYGPNYELNKENLHHIGSFDPDDLINHLDGSFGLIWDGKSVNTCDGIMGEYLKINNPHKTSLYLAAGLPIIIWKNAALASFIEENGCGITINSITEIKDKIDNMTNAEYLKIKENIAKVSKDIRQGKYMKTALLKAIYE